MTLRLAMPALKSISGSSTLSGTSSLTLPESAFRSKAALLSCRDSILAWIVHERLCSPEFEKLLPHLYLPTSDGLVMLNEVVSSLPNAG